MILGGIVVVICAVIVFTLLKQPGRSIANFCQVAKEQKTILIDDVNYEQRLEAYKKLEVVSPDEIKPDITTIRKGYEAIVQDPSSTLSTGFGISGAENRRTDFINQNCSDF
jgi:hypothetical protein